MGMVHAVQKGDMKAPSSEIEEAAQNMKKKDVTDFAGTKHKGLPTKVKRKNKMNKLSYYQGYMEKAAVSGASLVGPSIATSIGAIKGGGRKSRVKGAVGAGAGSYIGGKLGEIPGLLLKKKFPGAGKALENVGRISGLIGGGVGGYKAMTPSDEEMSNTAEIEELKKVLEAKLAKTSMEKEAVDSKGIMDYIKGTARKRSMTGALIPALAATAGGIKGSKKDSDWSAATGAVGAGGGAYLGGKLGEIPGLLLKKKLRGTGKALTRVGRMVGLIGGGVGGYKALTPSDNEGTKLEVLKAKLKELEA